MNLIRGIKKEVQRTRWLGFDDLKSMLIVVIIFIILFGLFFIGIDFMITAFLAWLGVNL